MVRTRGAWVARRLLPVFALLTALAAQAEVVLDEQEGLVSVNYTDADLVTVIDDFAEAVDISVSFKRADLARGDCTIFIENIPWRDCFVLLTEPYGIAIHQVHDGKDVIVSGNEEIGRMTKDKPLFLLPAVAERYQRQSDSPLDVVRAVHDDFRGWTFTKQVTGVVALLSLLAFAYHWSATMTRLSTSSMARGFMAAMLSAVIGLALSILPWPAALAVGIPVLVLLIKAVFTTTIARSILILPMAGACFAVFAAVAVMVIYWVGTYTVPY